MKPLNEIDCAPALLFPKSVPFKRENLVTP